jgi:hypothetical protein
MTMIMLEVVLIASSGDNPPGISIKEKRGITTATNDREEKFRGYVENYVIAAEKESAS